MTATPEPIDIDWDATTEPPLAAGAKPAAWSHADWPESGAA